MKVVLQHLKTFTKAILKSISSAQSDRSDSAGNKSELQTTDMLQFYKMEETDYVSMATRLVLNHPVIQKYFLLHDEGNQSRKVSKVITDCVTKVLSSAVEFHIDITSSIDFYFNKSEKELESKNFQDSLPSVLNLVIVLTDLCSAIKRARLFKLLLQFECPDENICEYTSVLESLIGKLVTSSLQHLNLSEGEFEHLILAWVARGMTNTDDIARLVCKFPVLSVVCSVKCFNHILTLDLENSHLLQMLLSNNMTLTLEMMKKIDTADKSLFEEKKLSLVHTCLKVTSSSEVLRGMFRYVSVFCNI